MSPEMMSPDPNPPEEKAPPRARTVAELEQLAALYEKMQLIRRIEEEAARAYAQGKIGGFLHLYIGQEAVGVGAIAALEPSDYVITTYRDHGIALAKGMSPNALMAELFGKKTGCSGGLGGSMHMFDAEHRMLGGYGIVGGHIPLAAGVAFASKYRNDRAVTLCFFGEGAVSIGGFHEGVSLAALWKLPIVFICENNGYAMGTAVSRGSAETHFYRRGTAFRIPGMDVNGMDVLEVRQATEVALDFVRAGNGPVLMELKTYRYRGHSMSDPAKYRTREEVQDMRDHHDPIEAAKQELLKRGVTEDRMKDIDKAIRAIVAQAADFAENSPEPAPAELYTDVLVENY